MKYDNRNLSRPKLSLNTEVMYPIHTAQCLIFIQTHLGLDLTSFSPNGTLIMLNYAEKCFELADIMSLFCSHMVVSKTCQHVSRTVQTIKVYNLKPLSPVLGMPCAECFTYFPRPVHLIQMNLWILDLMTSNFVSVYIKIFWCILKIWQCWYLFRKNVKGIALQIFRKKKRWTS